MNPGLRLFLYQLPTDSQTPQRGKLSLMWMNFKMANDMKGNKDTGTNYYFPERAWNDDMTRFHV